jgi:hypothetical protein
MKISEHITFEEATISPTALRLGIKNEPNEAEYTAMVMVANYCFEPLRKWYGKPIKVNSFFRCAELNKAVGGKPTSQHQSGHAIDMSAGSKEENKKLYDWCAENLEFDQLIWEFGGSWIHISYVPDNNRKMKFEVK